MTGKNKRTGQAIVFLLLVLLLAVTIGLFGIWSINAGDESPTPSRSPSPLAQAVPVYQTPPLAQAAPVNQTPPVKQVAQANQAQSQPQDNSVVIDLSDPARWYGTLMAYENHTETAAIEKLEQGLRFVVVPYLGKASHVWLSEPLLYPVHYGEHYPWLVVRYRATNIENKSKLSVVSLRQDGQDTGRIRFEPLKVHQLVADGQPQVFRVDLRKVSTGGKRTGIAHQFAVSVRGNGQGAASFELLDLRFEKDPSDTSDASVPVAADQPLAIQVVDEQDQPVQDARVALRSLRLDRVQFAKTDDQGKATLTPWETASGSYVVEVSANGMATTIHPGINAGEQVLVKLEKAHDIQGVVRNANGKPVAGALVVFGGDRLELPRGQWHVRPRAVFTDDQGRWKQSGFPTSRSKVVIAAWHEDAPEPYEASMELGEHVKHYTLGSGPVDITLAVSWAITGKVMDDQGKPVSGVKVYRDNQFNIQDRKPPVLTDDHGQYVARNFKPTDREVTLTFIKENKAPLQVKIEAGEAPVNMQRDVQLVAGKEFHFVVVDQDDKPVKGVRILSGGLENFHGNLLDAYTDAKGRVSWVSGPDQAMQFSIIQNRRPVSSVEAQPGQVSRVVLSGPTTHTGTVVDASTGQAVKAYQVSVAYALNDFNRQPDGPPYGWWQNPLDIKHEKGQFEYSARPTQRTWYLRIVADGYAPFVSEGISADAPSQKFAVKLTPVKTIAGRVLLPDGKPADKARVYVVMKSQWLLFTSDGTFGDRKMLETELFTDQEGRFKLPAEYDREEMTVIVIVHNQGSLEIRDHQIDAMDPAGPVTLEPWATLSGQAMRSGKPDPNATIVAFPLYFPQDKDKAPRNDFDKRDVRWNFKVQADDQGRFTLRMPPAGYEIGKQIEYAHRAWRPSQTHHLLLKAGEHRKDFKIGGEGRSFTLKLKWKDQPPEWKVGFANISPTRRQDMDRPHYKMINELADLKIPEHHHHQDYEVTVDFDQVVHGHDIPPGKYQLHVRLWSERFTDNAKIVADIDTIIDIPQITEAQQQTVVDLGELEVGAPEENMPPSLPARPAQPGQPPAPPR